MRTHVEFRSDAFPRDESEDGCVNPECWGKNLASFLGEKLQAFGIAVEEIYSEDWGWVVPIEHSKFPMWLGCGNYDEYPNGFLVFIEPSRPFVKKGLFRKIDTRVEVEKLAVAITAILEGDDRIRDVRWWSEEECC